MKMKKKVLFGVIALTCILMITACCLFAMYKTQAKYVSNIYLKAINNRDYKTAISLIYKDEKIKDYTEKELIKFLEKYFQEKNFVKVEASRTEIGEKKKDTEYSFFEVKYTFENQSVTSTLSFIKVDNNWKVIFPFKVEDVHIYAPLGASVWFEQDMITKKEENKYTVPNVLPGNYVVRIAFPNKICGDYITTINVPTVTEVIIPYETVEVSVECMSGTVVELAGEKMINKDGLVRFDNVLEGTYPLKIYDINGNIEAYEQYIVVSKKNRQFNIENLNLSDIGNARLKKSTDEFYVAYLEGIKKHDSSFINQYALKDIEPQIVEDFESWFIKDKDLQTAEIDVEIEEINMNKDGILEVQTLEVVEMMNKEIDAGGKAYQREYQVTLKWLMELVQEGEGYKLKDRTIQESLVSYKDRDGRWIAY